MPLKHILLAILVAAIWGFNFLFVKLGVQEIPPLFLCALRFFVVSFPAIFFLPMPTGSFKMVALYGLIMFALQFALIFSGISLGMPAGMASLLLQTGVFFSILFAAFFNAEIPTFWQLSGALISFSGIAIAATHFDANMTPAGFSLVIAGAGASGMGNLITRKIQSIPMATLVCWGSLIAFPPLLIFSFIIEGFSPMVSSIQHFSWLGLTALFYIVYMSTWVGYSAWSWLLRRYPISSVVPFALLVPVFGMLGSTLFLGENFEAWKVLAACLVITGLIVNLIVPRLLNKIKQTELSLQGSK